MLCIPAPIRLAIVALLLMAASVAILLQTPPARASNTKAALAQPVIAGAAFVDLDGNGDRGAGEPSGPVGIGIVATSITTPTLAARYTRTDATGAYRLSLPAGRWLINAYCDFSICFDGDYQITADQTIDIPLPALHAYLPLASR